MIFAFSIAVLFGVYEQGGAHFFLSIPEVAFEAWITIYLVWKGFRPSPILDDTQYAPVARARGARRCQRRSY